MWAATQLEGISRFRCAQIVRVDGAVRIQDLGKPELHLRPSRIEQDHTHHAGKILSEVVDENAGLGFSDGLWLKCALHANGRKIMSHYLGWSGMDNRRPLMNPIVVKVRARHAHPTVARIHRLAVV